MSSSPQFQSTTKIAIGKGEHSRDREFFLSPPGSPRNQLRGGDVNMTKMRTCLRTMKQKTTTRTVKTRRASKIEHQENDDDDEERERKMMMMRNGGEKRDDDEEEEGSDDEHISFPLALL